MTAQVVLALAVGIAATVEDIARRRISNWIPVFALIAGLASGFFRNGWKGAGMSALGAAGGFAVFLVFYVFGGMGGGDVKLMAGFGAILGLGRLPMAALWTALAGGLLALAAAGWSAMRRSGPRKTDSIPYAPAIALGAWLALVSG